MADPLSIAGLGIGVVSLGLQVSGAITTYFDALDCRGKDLASVRRQNDALRTTVQFVETSLSQFQPEHHVTTTMVHECVDSCKKELNALQSLVADLTVCDQSTTSRKNRLKNHGKKLLYPFSRPKIEQLEARIDNANATLQLALQTLGLSVSQLGSEKLTALEATSHNISASLVAVQSNILAMSSPLQGIQSTVSGIESRFDTLEDLVTQLLSPQPANSGSPQGIGPTAVTGRLLRKPGVLKDICDAVGARERSRPSEALLAVNESAAQFGNNFSMYTGGRFTCLCRRRRHFQRRNVGWGSLTLSLEASTEQHLPGCPATQVVTGTNRSRKISLTYSGLRHLLNSAIQLSFATQWGAGAWSLSPNFTYYPTVDSKTAPAFRILSLLLSSRHICGMDYELWRDKLLPAAASAVLMLFRAQKASPRAVDANNRSLVFHLAILIARGSQVFERRLLSQAKSSPLLELLEYLLVSKAPANEYDLSGHTPLSSMFSTSKYSSAAYYSVTDPQTAAAAELILRSNAEANMVCLSTLRPEVFTAYIREYEEYKRLIDEVHIDGTAVLRRFLTHSTRMAEAYGCGPLSLAVLSKNVEQVEHLVKNHPETLAERNVFGHTPLHLAAGTPSCLRLLVEAADTSLLNQVDFPDELGKSPLETAVILSEKRCQGPRGRRRLCRRCTCADCAVMLLKADCALPVSGNLQKILENASERCKLRYIRHMKDRRDRLRQLGLENLPATQVEHLNLTSERVLDSLAPRVTQLLQDSGVCIPEALSVARNALHSSFHRPPSSVYQALDQHSDAGLFFRVGFHDVDSWCQANATEPKDILPYTTRGLPYLYWLAKHGALSCQLKSFTSARDILVAHFIFWQIGSNFKMNKWPFHRNSGLGESLLASPFDDWRLGRAWIHELHTAALPAAVTDLCRCKCSPGGCTPLTSLLKGAVGTYFYGRHSTDGGVAWGTDSLEDSVVGDPDQLVDSTVRATGPLSKLIASFMKYLVLFGASLEVTHHIAALRYVTFTALGIPHTCCHPLFIYASSPEDAAEIEDEHAYELALLEELLGEFEGEVTTILQTVDWVMADLIAFWKRTWVSRMREILSRLDGSDLGDGERREAEEIGVVWDRPQPPEVPSNPYKSDTVDHWMYELDKIVAQCQ